VVDLGSGGTHDYRIALQSETGEAELDLKKTTASSLQQQQTTGRMANYSIDGAAAVDSATRAVTVTGGVTLKLLGTSAKSIDVTVTRSTSALSSALSTFTDAYNATVDELAKERGQQGGALQGSSLVNLLSNSLRELSTYHGSDTISGLRDLGLELGADGHLSFQAFTLMSKDLGNSAGVTAFFGSATGGGFLKTATDVLNELEASTTGLLKNAESDVQNQISNLGKQISTKQAQVDQMQINLTKQISAADALIASMEQQYSYLNNMFQAQQTADQMYK